MFRVDWTVPLGGGVTGLGEKVPLVPDGLPVNFNVTDSSKSLTEVTVTVKFVELSRNTVRSSGVIDKLKLGAVEAVTVTKAVAQWLFSGEPPRPHTVKTLIPSAVLRLVEILNVVVTPVGVGVIGLVLNSAVLPVGMFE